MNLFKFATIIIFSIFVILPANTSAVTTGTATTTLTTSICGNALVDGDEQCDVPGETGVYSTTIVGRQCDVSCDFGPYCGDGILQTFHSEDCDDGNNLSGDFCSAICSIEPAGSGGGGSSGGGGGGSNRELGDTQISVRGLSYPSRTINILLDTKSVGKVKASDSGSFEFTTEASPGTASLSFWATDSKETRSITLNTTFDVTQGAVTNIKGIILPPTIRVENQNVNPGDIITVSGQSIPDAGIELHVDADGLLQTGVTDDKGLWSILLDTGKLQIAEHTIKVRSITGTPPLTTSSNFSTSLQLFVGVDGTVTTPSDLNRDGKIDLIDFSILIFWWGTDAGNSDPSADINGNGNVGIEDFSILLFNWTG
jgi:cysteine-rich repeat protein